MACLYKRKDGPYLWLKSKVGGVEKQESTGLRADNAEHRRRAKQILYKKQLEESEAEDVTITAKGWAWVEPFLRLKYSAPESAGTLGVYLQAWRPLSEFLDENDIENPRQFMREHCALYFSWRKKRAEETSRPVGANVIAKNISFFANVVLAEAMKRGWITVNVALDPGFPREKVREKPVLTAEHDAIIREIIEKERDPIIKHMLHVSFEISRHQGCRLAETRMNLSDVDLARKEIRFHAKGGKVFTTALHPNLVPLFEQLRREKRAVTWEPKPASPKAPARWASRVWSEFFHEDAKLSNGGISFHCTRVTVVTELARAGVSLSQAMRFVGHASELVHAIYQRLQADDVSGCTKFIAATGSPLSANLPQAGVCPTCGQPIPSCSAMAA